MNKATIGWIDFSPTHRNRIGSVLDLLRPEGMVDELGMGILRDSISNEMFPGISTIQTRAKYFFIVPYILYEYQLLKSSKQRNQEPKEFLKKREYEIMWQLAETYKYEDGHGVIGITKHRPNKIVRRPSAIYWNGLNIYGFINSNNLSVDAFLGQTKVNTTESLKMAIQKGDDAFDDEDIDFSNMFKLKVFPKKNWDLNLSLELSKKEAEIFKDRITSVSPNKLVSELLMNKEIWQLYDSSNNFKEFSKKAIKTSFNSNLKEIIVLAHDFSELMYGAHLAYNNQLHHKIFNSKYFDNDWYGWIDKLNSEMIDYDNFNPYFLFEHSLKAENPTQLFIRNWWSFVQSESKNINLRDSLVFNQEYEIKRDKARLRYNKIHDVKEDKWLGLKHFDYRFKQVKTIIKDIRTGLEK
jgi:hypothetical protein